MEFGKTPPKPLSLKYNPLNLLQLAKVEMKLRSLSSPVPKTLHCTCSFEIFFKFPKSTATLGENLLSDESNIPSFEAFYSERGVDPLISIRIEPSYLVLCRDQKKKY